MCTCIYTKMCCLMPVAFDAKHAHALPKVEMYQLCEPCTSTSAKHAPCPEQILIALIQHFASRKQIRAALARKQGSFEAGSPKPWLNKDLLIAKAE